MPAIVAPKERFLSVAAFIRGPSGFPWCLQMPELAGLLLLQFPGISPSHPSRGVVCWGGGVKKALLAPCLFPVPSFPKRFFPASKRLGSIWERQGKLRSCTSESRGAIWGEIWDKNIYG